jgi:hypothetical protein
MALHPPVAGALFRRLALCRYNNIVSGLGQASQRPTIRKQRFAQTKPTRQLATSNGGATILVPGRACRWLGTVGRYPSSYRPPPPRPAVAVSVAVHTVGPLRCVALFNQKHASPRLASAK